MKVLFFTDADKDDIYSLTVLIAQCVMNGVEIMGIVCDDGFLSYPQNISVVQFWLKDILNFNGIDVYRGRDRDEDLKQNRNFPEAFITSYLDVLKSDFAYMLTDPPTYKSLDELMVKISRARPNSISVLTTGNMTTLSYLLTEYTTLKSKIKTIFSMIGNYNVPGNVLPVNGIPPNSEYNAYLDPASFSNVAIINRTNLQIVPLDCTNNARLTEETITKLQELGAPYYANCQNEQLKNIYNQFVTMLTSTLITENTTLYMWDLVATILFIKKSVGQTYITQSIDIADSGKINANYVDDNQKCIIYTYCDYDKLLTAIIESLFIPIPQDVIRVSAPITISPYSRGKFPSQPNSMNKRIAKSLCGRGYPCPQYIFAATNKGI